MREYTVYGDYGFSSQGNLFSSCSQSEAIQWAKDYTKDGDLGGYNIIEVGFFYPNGEYDTVYSVVSECDDDDEYMQSAYSYNL